MLIFSFSLQVTIVFVWYVGRCTMYVKVIDVKLEKINQAVLYSLVKSSSSYEVNFCINPCTVPTRQAVFSAPIKLLVGLL